jgi:hypothetical protein
MAGVASRPVAVSLGLLDRDGSTDVAVADAGTGAAGATAMATGLAPTRPRLVADADLPHAAIAAVAPSEPDRDAIPCRPATATSARSTAAAPWTIVNGAEPTRAPVRVVSRARPAHPGARASPDADRAGITSAGCAECSRPSATTERSTTGGSEADGRRRGH